MPPDEEQEKIDIRQIGYCTNVHAGNDLKSTKKNLHDHALAVKKACSPDQPMGIGLWLSAATAADLNDDQKIDEFGHWLSTHGILPFTLNGFPYGDFHQKIVKHAVYEPTWADQRRLDYTISLINILHRILPEGIEGSISTLPVCWSTPQPTPEFVGFAAEQLRRVARHLSHLESESGRLIYLCIEPEPGCFLQTSQQLVSFMENDVLSPSAAEEDLLRRHLRVCHDVCHAAVMFESQFDVLNRYRKAGIKVGKVQVSSAIRLSLKDLSTKDRITALTQLSEFAEDRYLHQTTVQQSSGLVRFFEDLPLALQQHDVNSDNNCEMRVHYHVPIYLEAFGNLQTTQGEIYEVMSSAENLTGKHFEVETYAWDVLPDSLQQSNLSAGIAAEIDWFLRESQI